jgi:hypothetical protein
VTPDKFEEDQQEFTIFEKKTSQYSEALNSVIYFATLPYKLQDFSQQKFIEETTIKDKQV